MHPILVLVRKDFTNFFRNKAAVSLTFIVPFVMIYLFGQIFGSWVMTATVPSAAA